VNQLAGSPCGEWFEASVIPV